MKEIGCMIARSTRRSSTELFIRQNLIHLFLRPQILGTALGCFIDTYEPILYQECAVYIQSKAKVLIHSQSFCSRTLV